jgi:hypothetical protein
MRKNEIFKSIFANISWQIDDNLNETLNKRTDCKIKIGAVCKGKTNIKLILSKA